MEVNIQLNCLVCIVLVHLNLLYIELKKKNLKIFLILTHLVLHLDLEVQITYHLLKQS